MFVHRSLLGAALAIQFSSTAAESVTSAPTSMITAAAELKKRDPDTSSDFVGYYSTPGGYDYSTCSGMQYMEQKGVLGYTYGGCETANYVTIFTYCNAGTVYGSSWYSTYLASTAATMICNYGCITDYRVHGFATNYFIQCDTSRTAYTFYDMPSSILPGVAQVLSTTSTPSIPFIIESSTTTSPFPGPTESHSPIPTPKPKPIKKPNNTGKLAGGVVGGIAAIVGAIVAFLVWLKKRRSAKSSNQDPSVPILVEQPNHLPGGPGSVSVPEKAVMTPSTAPVSPYPCPPPQQQQWNSPSSPPPPPQQQWPQNPMTTPAGSPPPQWNQNLNGGPPAMVSPSGLPPPQWNQNLNSGPPMVSPPGSPPPPQYFPPQAQPVGYQQPYHP